MLSFGEKVANHGCVRNLFIYLFLMKKCLFLREREREREGVRAGEGQRERGRQRIQSRLCADSREPSVGLELMNCEIQSQMLNRVSHPGASGIYIKNQFVEHVPGSVHTQGI